MINNSIKSFLKLHGITEANYKVICEQYNVEQMTPLETPWVCERCGFTRIFEESKREHIDWHQRRLNR